MKICFIYGLQKGKWQWADGLKGAMEIIEKEHEVCYHFDEQLHGHTPDLLMCWGGILSKPFAEGLNFKGKKILFFGGGDINQSMQSFVTVFENDYHERKGKEIGLRCLTGFGTNTKVFKPMKQPKLFDVFYPGAFGLWKRKDLFARSCKGLKAFTCGNVQSHEMQCWDVCIENGIAVAPDIMQDVLPYFYNMSKCTLVLPIAYIGCQRTVLESMACKIPVIVPSDAPLVVEYAVHGGIIVPPEENAIREAVLSADSYDSTEAYEYVMDNLTERHYAEKIKEAIEMA